MLKVRLVVRVVVFDLDGTRVRVRLVGSHFLIFYFGVKS